ncbi:MAG: hypothetical protein WBN40_12805 [Pseudomonadales bacterium]
MAKKANAADNKFIDLTRDMLYASLGVQKVAYEFGVDKYEAFTKARKKDIRNYIKRGEELEAQIREMYEEFKGADNLVAKGVAGVEEQVEKVVKLASGLSDKVVKASGLKKSASRKAAPGKAAPRKQPAAKRSTARKAA